VDKAKRSRLPEESSDEKPPKKTNVTKLMRSAASWRPKVNEAYAKFSEKVDEENRRFDEKRDKIIDKIRKK